jgi:predicted PurR-regulated permease PerM
MNDRLSRTIKVMVFLVLLIIILVYARPFLVPLTFGAIFAMLLLPLSLKLEKWGMSRGLAILLSTLLLLVVIAGIVTVFAWQVSGISENSAELENNINQKLQELRNYVSQHFGISMQKQEQIIKEQQKDGGGQITGFISGFISGLGGFLTDLILTLVYVFLFLYFRPHLKKFVLMLVPATSKKNAGAIMEEAGGVAQRYLTGMAWMILCLWIMYSIGFSIIGIKNAVFFAILCGLLEIVPFVGNLTGNVITVIAAIMQGGGSGMIIGVIITYASVQFIQTYILEPLVVGKGVSINPLFTIAGIVGMEQVWGIAGMILAIPLLGITKIICDHVDSLKPYGFLIGSEKQSKESIISKIKKWFS